VFDRHHDCKEWMLWPAGRFEDQLIGGSLQAFPMQAAIALEGPKEVVGFAGQEMNQA
jgi:hypothetical protein